MLRRPRYSPAADLKTETLRVAVPLETKRAVEAAAHRAGRPVAALVRDAVEEVIAGSSTGIRGGRS